MNTGAADAAQIQGSVVDERTGAPLPGANVWLREFPSVGVATDQDGHYSLEIAALRPLTVEVSHMGYRNQHRPIRPRPQRPNRLNFALEIEILLLPPVTIVGDWGEELATIPGSAMKLDRMTLQAIRPMGTQELLEHVPGIHGFADDGAGTSRLNIGIRGLNPRRSSRVLVLEDGVPIQPALYLYPNLYYNPPAERIDAVEIIKGAAAIGDGPQTMGGVINYITRRPRQDFGGLVRTTGGSNRFASLVGEIGGFGNDQLHPELQFLGKRGDGFRDHNDFTQLNGTFKLHYVPDDDRVLYLKANTNYENSAATYTGLTEYSFETDPTFNPKEDDKFTVLRGALDLAWTRRHSTTLSEHTLAYASLFDRRWWRENDLFVKAGDLDSWVPGMPAASPDDFGDLVRIGNGRDNLGILRTFYTIGAERTYNWHHSLLGLEAKLDVGARLHWERFVDDKKTGDSPDARNGRYFIEEGEDITIVGQSNHYETMALALHLTETFQWGDLTVLPGLRFEVFEQERIDRLRGSIYEDKTSWVILPGLGLNYRLGHHHAFAGIHRGYTPPSSGTLGLLDFGAGSIDLRSEKSTNLELGARGAGDGFSYEATLFHLGIEDMVAAGRGTAFRNLGRVKTRGAELSFGLRGQHYNPWFVNLDVSYTYLESEILEGTIISAIHLGDANVAGNELPYAPRHAWTIGLSRSIGASIEIRVETHFVDRVFTDFENIETTGNRGDTGPVEAYMLHNLSTDWKLSSTWSAFAVAKNVSDEIYVGSRLHSNPRQTQAGMSSGILPGPRRQINAGIQYRF